MMFCNEGTIVKSFENQAFVSESDVRVLLVICYFRCMKRCLFLLIIFPLSLTAQFQDNFADGEFTSNPNWIGETVNFDVNANRLHLNAPVAASSSYLSAPSGAIHNASWEFYVEMGFATSSTSMTRVYLVSDQADLKQALNGYFVMIGNTADEVSLYRQTGTIITKIIDGLDSRVGASTVSVKVKVTRDATGQWTLWVDVGNTGTYVQEASPFTDLTHTASNYFGVYCLYTATRSTLFWFDDFDVTGTVVPDMNPPTVTSVVANSSTEISVLFSETVEANSAQLTGNYLIHNNSPSMAMLQPDNKTVLLTLSSPLTNGLPFSINLSGVQDLDGNVMHAYSENILYFVPLPVSKKDIIVSELMADPSPVVGLPEAEFIELYNRSANPINLLGWKLSDGDNPATLPQYILMPGNFIVVTTTSSASSFSGALGVPNFPSLNNSGDNIILKNDLLITIDSIHYSTSWYHSEDKQDGGWSLEIVDPENLCEEEGNWTASESQIGGTPGIINSVNANNPDLTAPLIQIATIETPTKILVSFSEKLDANSLISASLEPTIGVTSISYSTDLHNIEIATSENLQPSKFYVLTLGNVYDCPGNALEENSVPLILPESAVVGDILLNEILFNPKSGGVDFVEVYNTSEKFLSLKKWSLANVDNEVAVDLHVIQGSLVIAPKSFLVFTPDPTILKSHYSKTIDAACVTATLPSMNDDEGSIALVDSLSNVMDFFLYQNDYHVAFLKDDEGVSLERVSLTSTTNNANNWRSASQHENFATPGYKNSASTDGKVPVNGEVQVDPEIFSPQSPPADFTTINYRFNQSGQVANVRILDHQGRLIKTLANNEVLGTDGFFRWDGDQDDGGRARAGYYAVWLEVFDSQGNVTTFRKRVVVSFR